MTAKLFLSEKALQMTTDAIAIAGKSGYLRENGSGKTAPGCAGHRDRRARSMVRCWEASANPCAARTVLRICTKSRGRLMDLAAHPQAVFVVTAQISLTRQARRTASAASGQSQTARGELPAPGPGLVLWRVIERVTVEKQLLKTGASFLRTDGQKRRLQLHGQRRRGRAVSSRRSRALLRPSWWRFTPRLRFLTEVGRGRDRFYVRAARV